MLAPPSKNLCIIIILLSLENELWLPIDEPPDDLYRFRPFAEVVVPPPGPPSWLR